jgi:hypothetical protein
MQQLAITRFFKRLFRHQRYSHLWIRPVKR